MIILLRFIATIKLDQYRAEHFTAFIHIKHTLNILIMIFRMITTVGICAPIMALTNYFNIFLDTPWWTLVFLLAGGELANFILAFD